MPKHGRAFEPDAVILDEDDGSERVLIEVTRKGSSEAEAQLVARMRLTKARAGLLVDPIDTLIVSLLFFDEDRPAKATISTQAWGVRLYRGQSEPELVEEVVRALHRLADKARDGRYSEIPREFFPDVIFALEHGNLRPEAA